MANNKRARENKAIRQQALREQLAEQCRLQHIVDNLNKIESLDPTQKESMNELNILKTANEQRFKLLNKYLPDLSNITLSGDEENPLKTDNKWVIEVVDSPQSVAKLD